MEAAILASRRASRRAKQELDPAGRGLRSGASPGGAKLLAVLCAVSIGKDAGAYLPGYLLLRAAAQPGSRTIVTRPSWRSHLLQVVSVRA